MLKVVAYKKDYKGKGWISTEESWGWFSDPDPSPWENLDQYCIIEIEGDPHSKCSNSHLFQKVKTNR